MNENRTDLAEILERAQRALHSDGLEGFGPPPAPGGAVDRFFTWGHEKFIPKSWCADDPQHWTWRLVDILWIDCACCFMFRGIVVGAVAASIVWAAVFALVM